MVHAPVLLHVCTHNNFNLRTNTTSITYVHPCALEYSQYNGSCFKLLLIATNRGGRGSLCRASQCADADLNLFAHFVLAHDLFGCLKILALKTFETLKGKKYVFLCSASFNSVVCTEPVSSKFGIVLQYTLRTLLYQ